MLGFNLVLADLLTEEMVDARQLHEALEVKQEFIPWIRSRIKQFDLQIGGHYFHPVKRGHDHLSIQDRPLDRTVYLLEKYAIKILAMTEPGEQGDCVREYYIDCATKHGYTPHQWETDRTARYEAYVAHLDAMAEEQAERVM